MRRTDWAERDLALVLTTDDAAAVVHVKRKGGKKRSVPIEAALLSVIEAYLDRLALGSLAL
jgi:site-specific recombinase XerD